MAKQPESRLVSSIREMLDQDGWYTWKNHGGPYMAAGLPDIMGLKDGRFLAVEAKMPGRTATPTQTRTLARLAERGAIVVVAYSVADVADAIERARPATQTASPSAPLAFSGDRGGRSNGN